MKTPDCPEESHDFNIAASGDCFSVENIVFQANMKLENSINKGDYS
jgi:hypothetical protein